MGLQDTIDALWSEVVSRLETNLSSDYPGTKLHTWRAFYANRTSKAVVVLSRSVTMRNAAVRLLEGELTVQFGCMADSGDFETGQKDSEALAYWLSETMLADPFLDGAARDVRVDAIDLDFDAPTEIAGDEPERSSKRWSSVVVTWEFNHSRP
ncbi:MAG: hypothetical protein ACOC5M_00230 [Chloroflexota bacterium]